MMATFKNPVGLAAIFLVVTLSVSGCAPTVRLQFRYVESQEPVVGGAVVIRPSIAFADPLLPFKKKTAITSAEGEVELPLQWKPESEAKAIELTESDGGCHEWSMGNKDLVNRHRLDQWIGEQGKWVAGYTDTRVYETIEVLLIEKDE